MEHQNWNANQEGCTSTHQEWNKIRSMAGSLTMLRKQESESKLLLCAARCREPSGIARNPSVPFLAVLFHVIPDEKNHTKTRSEVDSHVRPSWTPRFKAIERLC